MVTDFAVVFDRIGCQPPEQWGQWPRQRVRGAIQPGSRDRAVGPLDESGPEHVCPERKRDARISDEGLRRYPADSDPAARRRSGR
ncbi:hypothetical protein NLM24_00070 [Nocardia zapadnayensis]|uniref:hypothetical protein n=1 Tax=Nocardia rhamnosiphila TaxID=426716 RepID=UPI002247F279|nr:hypothetical protein [Nocardia zapadnayensis]MCX0269136.1 hypothetical protein [Nocardia zapadnayensis]